MERRPLNVLGKRVLLGDAFGTHHTRDQRGAGEPLLFHQKLERAIPPPTGRHFETAGLGTIIIEDRPDGEALQECAARNVRCELLDRDARLDAANIGLTKHELVKRNVARLTERDLLNGLCHLGFSATGGREPFS